MQKNALAKATDVNQIPLSFRKLKDKYTALCGDQYSKLTSAFAPYMNDVILDSVARLGSVTGGVTGNFISGKVKSVNMDRYYFLVGPENYQTSEE